MDSDSDLGMPVEDVLRVKSQGKMNDEESVLLLQGGGSLGAYECGVCKAFAKNDIEFDTIGGTSIGAVNAAILTAGRPLEQVENFYQNIQSDDKHASANHYDFKSKVKILEDFWLYIADDQDAAYNWVLPDASTLQNLFFLPFFSALSFAYGGDNKARMAFSSMRSFTLGNPKVATPKWFMPFSSDYFTPYKWPYLYDISPLKTTVSKFVDFSLLGASAVRENDIRKGKVPRLIITATDIQAGDVRIFDSHSTPIDASTIVGCTGYPFYGISWIQSNGRYLWDGSLIKNTILLSMLRASPDRPKRVYLVNVFPRGQDEMPQDLLQSIHRARDILFEDKTSSLQDSVLRDLSDLYSLLEEAQQFLKSDSLSNVINSNKNSKLQNKLDKLLRKCAVLTTKRGTIIRDLIRVQRNERTHFLYEDADFSRGRIKHLIQDG